MERRIIKDLLKSVKKEDIGEIINVKVHLRSFFT